MKLTLVAIFLAALLWGQNAEARKNYDGYRTYSITLQNEDHIDVLKVYKSDSRFDFWTFPRMLNRNVVVMVSPSAQAEFEKQLSLKNIEFSILMDNVERAVEREIRSVRTPRKAGKISFDQYYRYDDIVDYVNEIAANYPDLAKTKVIGQTSEGRDIISIAISSGGNGTNPAILIEAGIHAREWIAPALALYIINQLVENSDQTNTDLSKVDWIIVPVTNPDGYEYTHTDDRFWRKNRQPNGLFCTGVDCNRNFGFHWGEEGASTFPCDETYRGKSAFSEAESDSLRELAAADKGRIHLYIALHSYGPYFLYPWGYQWDLPDDWEDLDNLARSAVEAINKVHNYKFEIGSSTQLLYAASGGSDDYMKGGNDVKYAYTVELPGGGSQGFDPPPRDIIPIVTAVYEGIKVAGSIIAKNTRT